MKSEFTYQIGAEVRTVAIEREGDCFHVTVGENRYQIRARRPEHGRLNLQVGDRRLRAHVASDGPRRYVALAGQSWTLERPQPTQKRRGAAAGGQGAGSLEAAMPGLVLNVLVEEGDEVSQGQPLVLLSAMKMELRISAPADGVVVKVHCKAGDLVERGQLLVEIGEPQNGGDSSPALS